MTERLPDRTWVPAVGALALAVLFVAALLVRAGGDVSLLVHAGPPWTDPASARDSLTVQDADQAFDGQFFYRLGVAPWSTDETVDGVTFDLPSLRNARWGYGALAFVASGGDADLVPWALVGLNVVAAAAMGAIGGGLAKSAGRHAGWGLLLVLWPGFAYSISMDTSELVASTFALGGLLALRHRRHLWAGLALTAALLTRDTAAVIPFGVLVGGLVSWWSRRDREIRQAAAGLVPLVAFGAWQVLQWSRFDALPLTSSGDNNLSAPFGGLVEELGALVPPSGGDELFRLVSMLGLVALISAGAWAWWNRSGLRSAAAGPRARRFISLSAEQAAWVPAVFVVAVLNAYLWSGATAFMRAATEAALLSILLLLGSLRTRLLGLLAAALSGLWLLTVAAQLSKLG